MISFSLDDLMNLENLPNNGFAKNPSCGKI